MTKTFKKSMQWLFVVVFAIMLVLGAGLLVKPYVASAEQAVTINVAYLEGENNEKDGYLQIRMDTVGQTWTNSQNDKRVSELPTTVADYTTINGRTLTELQKACTSDLPIIVTLQPAGSFSFIRVWVPTDYMRETDVRSFGVLDGWAFNDGTANFTCAETTYLRSGGSLVLASNYTATTKLTSSNVTISDAQLVHRVHSGRGADSYMVDITLGSHKPGEYDAMYNSYAKVRSAIYINGKSIDEWNAQMIALDERFNDPSTYTYFPQNSTDPTHKDVFVKPIGLWGTNTGYRLSIFQELVADLETVTVTVGSGCLLDGQYMVAERVSKTVLTQTVVDVTNKLTFMDNSHNKPTGWGPTSMYYIHTNNEACWTKAPIGGCLNESDPSEVGGGQIQMKYIYFNGSTLYDINQNDNGAYNSTQDNIVNGGVYAPILVTMSAELGSSLKLTVPNDYTNGKAGHEEVVIKKGFSVKEGNTSYVVTADIVFTNDGSSWSKEIKVEEIKAKEIAIEVTGIVTYANRTDGGNNENFVVFRLSNNDYAGVNQVPITDISSLYGYIDIGGNVLNSRPNEPFFNVWNMQNTIAFRAPGLDASGLQQVQYITIKAGAKFPSYNTQNGGALTYYVTQEDVTFIHSVPNDVWTVGSVAQEHTVTFTVDGAPYHSATVTDGGVVSAPSAPTKAEDANYTYTFKQWTLNGSAYDFATPVTQDITLVAEFTATAKDTTFGANTVTIGNPRVGGDAKELYKVDIVSNSWTIACNYYDFMYGGTFANYRKLIFINGVSVYDINENTDDSAYVYSTFPMTGADDATFAKPILIETHAQNGGDPNKITIWIHKTYVDSLGDELEVTLGKGYNAYTGGLTLAENVNYDMMATVGVDDGTNTYDITLVKGSTLGSLGTPEKPMTETAIYQFDNWYIKDTNTVFNAETPITENLNIEARFDVTAVQLTETEVDKIFYNISKNNNDDRWLIFFLGTNDYPSDQYTLAAPASSQSYERLLEYGTFDKIIIKGEMTVGGVSKEQATIAELINANGYPQTEEIYFNIWENYSGSMAMRLFGVSVINEIVIESGAFFPSYETFVNDTSEKRFVVKRGGSFVATKEQSVGDNPLTSTGAVSVDIQMEKGASVRIAEAEGESGIRFTTKILKTDVDKLNALVESGECVSVSYGTIIVPSDYIVGGIFTHDWLTKNYGGAGVGFIELETTRFYRPQKTETDDYYYFHGSIVKLINTNFDRSFAALGYVKLTYADKVEYIYANYDEANVRSASYVAESAIKDRSEVSTDKYIYVTAESDYSPFTIDELGWLERYLTGRPDQDYLTATKLTNLTSKGGTQTVTLGQTGQKLVGPYVQLLYSTNVNVWGQFTYTDGSKTATEDFYLQAGTTEHKQYLDLFRENGVAYGMDANNITMTSITFTNAELDNSTTGEVRIMGMYSYNKTIDTENQEIYLTVKQEDNSYMTVGAHLGIGGALTYLAKTDVYEGVIGGSSGWKNGTVAISMDRGVFDSTNRYKSGSSSSSYSTEDGSYGAATPKTEPSATERIDGAVNLINNFDAGRQIQQSWYAQVGGTDGASSNGYTRAYCYTGSTEGQYWPYNPVQAGDVVSNPGQIIDYEINVKKGYIYVKARAMDWAKGYDPSKPCANAVEGGVTTKSYMENYYRLKADGTLTVNNTFVDWNGFTDMGSCDWASTELPAVYPVHTLNYYVSNIDGDGSWEDSIEYNSSLKPWTGGTAYHQFANPGDGQNSKVEDWFAWANGGDGNAFGMGVYIPNVDRFTSGRSNPSTAYYTDINFQNSNALPVDDYKEWNWSSFSNVSMVTEHAQRGNILADKKMLSNMQPIEYTYQSAYVSNTSYTAPGINFRMEAYKKIEYSYVICVDTVNDIRAKFKEIKDNGTVTNAGDEYQKVGLDAWARADKTWTW